MPGKIQRRRPHGSATAWSPDDYTRGRSTSPLGTFGTKYVDLGGITSPASATANTSSTLVGLRRTAAAALPLRTASNAARTAISGRRGEVGIELEVTVKRGEGKRARLNGAPLRAAEQLRSLVSTLVFTPDRLGVVKGPPAARRAYFDRVLGRLAPARAPLPAEYGAAVAQRNAALRRAATGLSGRDAIEPWSERVATLGAE